MAAPSTQVETGDEEPAAAGALLQKRETDKRRLDRLNRSWGVILNTMEGRTVVWDILTRNFGVRNIVAHDDPREEQRNIGKHSEGMQLLAKIENESPAFARLMKQENDF